MSHKKDTVLVYDYGQFVELAVTLAKEFGRYDCTVNAVAFGYIQTRLTKPLAQGEDGEIEGLF